MRKNVGDFALKERLALNETSGTLDFEALVLNGLDLRSGLNVLDVACGNGRFTVKYKEIVKNGLVSGIDQSEELINEAIMAATAKGVNIDFRVADAHKLPYDDGIFQRVSCNYAIYHFPDIPFALKEMLRVMTKDNSLLQLTGPARDNNVELFKCHTDAGASLRVQMGRNVYEDTVKAFLNGTSTKYEFNKYTNIVAFGSVDEFLSYYQNTKLFLDNTTDTERSLRLSVMRKNLEKSQQKPELTKQIGVFRIWN